MTSNEGSNECAHMRGFAWSFIARQCDKYKISFDGSYMLIQYLNTSHKLCISSFCLNLHARVSSCSTANINALRGSLGALSVNKLSHIPK